MDYELKHTNPPSTRVNDDGSAIITVGFTTGVVGCPDSYKMVTGDTIEVPIENWNSKTIPQVTAEVDAAIAAYIAVKYPST